ncbi:hypothetical protein AJ85_03610 [Alkalihalobacillus alcalophilus ATCC 27647 = CGMCC 1.3604]|uniref:Uncharacterized protein n=1 Tax=Alkalihalobacillus alcalophilus ATCC 27647 = CGMCC 1.3604 TaxID=1218173 RepID=A0A094WJE8_ALKAL|nr:hypothetical protein [Alkalihalobacillus alcalophilus]KGA97904.1 hypothetical protein BALCAV_0207685 [Alkalihalobacillus alcalophilus ATCC 27647 = CGMCC 1.3604]MED1561478.1 hypothetical protein [Alkalihalobacillus alcalophilus]THG88416.1 hypothetical protein AJ85_03610 [Alkalihalobacillus alcalophilus ATCC 27647 = CGMCC 1.3604]
MEWTDLTEGAKAVLEQTRNLKNDNIQIVEFEIGFEQHFEANDGDSYTVSIQEEDYQNLKKYTLENSYDERYHMARNKDIVKIILLEDGKIPDNLSEFPIFRQYKKEALLKAEAETVVESQEETE